MLNIGLNIVGDDVLCALEEWVIVFFGKLALNNEDI